MSQQYRSEATVSLARMERRGTTIDIYMEVSLGCSLPNAPTRFASFEVGPLTPGEHGVSVEVVHPPNGSLPGCGGFTLIGESSVTVAPVPLIPASGTMWLTVLATLAFGFGALQLSRAGVRVPFPHRP